MYSVCMTTPQSGVSARRVPARQGSLSHLGHAARKHTNIRKASSKTSSTLDEVPMTKAMKPTWVAMQPDPSTRQSMLPPPTSASTLVLDRRKSRKMPTVREWTDSVRVLVSPAAARTYGPYWNDMLEEIGDLPLDEVRATDCRRVAVKVRDAAVKRRNSRGGRGAEEHAIGAMRCVFRMAVADGLIDRSPADAVQKPRRLPNARRPLSADEMDEVWQVVSSTGDDPALDMLIVRAFIELGARREGLLGITLGDIDTHRQTIRLTEKGAITRSQPCSKTLLDALVKHATERGATKPEDQVLRYGNGKPITKRRMNYITNRVQDALPWAKAIGFSPHFLRHTAGASVERMAGYAVAKAFLGHTFGGDATSTYIKASEQEVARAVSALTGEEHPLA